ncbi:hypothetical protein [Acinetobacter sp. A2]|uniref:hypothetical protein n=1 Tax=Acinetobacter sp. A2 TaxID=362457 RepID=UPI001447D740|nr:hypothetical protein [Acinetobacter sp. A2]
MKIFLNFFIFVILFITVFNIKVFFPPYNLLVITGGSGFLIFLLKSFNDNLKINKFLLNGSIGISIAMIFFLFLSFLINQVYDFFFFKEIILFNFFSFFSAYLVVFLIEKKIKKENYLMKYIFYMFSLVVSMQLLLSFIAYLSPGFFNFLFGIFSRENIDDKAIGLNEIRMVGLGASFFGSGIINCFALIVLSSFIRFEKQKKIILFFIFFLIFFLGIMSARTTIIGFIISLFILFSSIEVVSKLLKFSILLLILLFLFNPIISFDNERVLNIISFGFDFLFDYENSQASKSTGELGEMWSNIPDNSLKTWIFGDVYYRDGLSYYKGIDIGYLRIIYSVGILGLLAFFYIHWYLISNITSKYFNFFVKIILFVMMIVLNAKGVTNFIPLLSIFYIAANWNRFILFK